MPRNVSGTYTLPLPPVTPNTVILAAWGNTTTEDIAQALTDSLDRYGRGGMVAPFRLVDGTAAIPAFAFASETGTGLYLEGTGAMSVSILGAKVAGFSAGGFVVKGPALEVASGIDGTAAQLELGNARTVNGQAYIDLHSAAGAGDYDFRILKDSGANGTAFIRNTGTSGIAYINEGNAPHAFYVNEERQFAIVPGDSTDIGDPDASGLWRLVFWPQPVSEVAWSMASLAGGWFAFNSGPTLGAVATNPFEFKSGSAFRQVHTDAATYALHIFRNKAVNAASHTIGAILFDAFRDVADPSYVAGIWADSTTPAGNVPVLRFGAVQNGGGSLPGITSGALMQLNYSGHLQLSGNVGAFGHMAVYSDGDNSTQPSYMARASLADGGVLWGYQITGQSAEPTIYRLALAATVSSISPGYPQHIYKWFLNQYNEFNSTSAQVLGTTGQWQFAVATGIISSAHLKTNWVREAGGLVDGLAGILDVGSFDIALGEGSPAIDAAPALAPGEHPDFPNGRPAIVARPARPPVTVRQVGVTAEAVEAIMPAAVTDAGDGLKSVAYGNAALVAAIALAKRLKALETFVGI